jgi:hypothetical protein
MREFQAATRSFARLCRNPFTDVVCMTAALFSTWLLLRGQNALGLPRDAWWTVSTGAGIQRSVSGWLIFLIWNQFFPYIGYRAASKVLFWTVFLRRFARMRLRLNAAHPDGTAGLAFLGVLQSKFGVLLFAYGIWVAGNTFQLTVVEGIPFSNYIVWSMVVLYMAVSPILFLMPMLTLTTCLRNLKAESLVRFGGLSIATLSRLEHLPKSATRRASKMPEVAMEDLSIAYDNVRRMRVVPMDLRSVMDLLAWAGAPMVPLILRFVPWPEIRHVLETFFH